MSLLYSYKQILRNVVCSECRLLTKQCIINLHLLLQFKRARQSIKKIILFTKALFNQTSLNESRFDLYEALYTNVFAILIDTYIMSCCWFAFILLNIVCRLQTQVYTTNFDGNTLRALANFLMRMAFQSMYSRSSLSRCYP